MDRSVSSLDDLEEGGEAGSRWWRTGELTVWFEVRDGVASLRVKCRRGATY